MQTVSSPVNPAVAIQAIHNLDLCDPVTKLMGVANRTPKQAQADEKAYRQFLMLVALHPETTLVPNRDIDELWHLHVLDMRKYEADCNAVFGRVVYHTPTYGKVDLRADLEATKALYFAEFGEEMMSDNDYLIKKI